VTRADLAPAAPLLIGLVGPIGCGKSTVAGWLVADGGRVIDADAVAREVSAPGEPGHDAILAHFGDSFRRADGSLDRAALGRHVFADPTALAELERIIHPLVRPRILAELAEARSAAAPVVVLEAIKLVEAGYAAMCDEVWLIDCSRADQRRRLIARGMSAADAAQRAAAQAGMRETLADVATRVVHTHGSLEEVRARVAAALVEARARGREAAQPGHSTAPW
jgi:dephospho-CoA kinase